MDRCQEDTDAHWRWQRHGDGRMGDDKNIMVVSVYSPHCPGRIKEWGVSQGRVTRQRWTREKCSGEAAACISPREAGGRLKRPGRRLRVANSSAQLSDGSRYAAQDCDMAGRSGREEASSRYKTGLAVFQQNGPEKEATTTPRGAGEMSAGETKGRPGAAMSSSRWTSSSQAIASIACSPILRWPGRTWTWAASLANGMPDNSSA